MEAGTKVIYLQGEIDVRTPGRVGLRLDAPEGLRLWIDDQPVPVAQRRSPTWQRAGTS